VRRALFKLYWAMRRVIAPGLNYSQHEYESVLRQHLQAGTEWLDVGCGHQILPTWRVEAERQLVARCKRVVGIDYDAPSLEKHDSIAFRVRGGISSLPFGDESFDTVTANMVVEHLDDPDIQFREVGRVLREGGLFIFHTPNAHGYFTALTRHVPESWKGPFIRALDGRPSGDVFKTHYKANTEEDVGRLAERNDLEIVELRLISTDAMFAMVPPLALVELAYIRILMSERFRRYRTNLIAVLRKKNNSGENGHHRVSPSLRDSAIRNHSDAGIKNAPAPAYRRRLIAVALLALIAWCSVSWVAARALIVKNTVPAETIAVLGGSATYVERTHRAAQLFHEGRATKILLTNDGERGAWSETEQKNLLFVELAAKELTRAGVPPEKIEVIWPPADNTFNEAMRLREYALAARLHSLLVVTSGYHSRRAFWTLSRVFAGNGVAVGIEPVAPGEQAPRPMFWWLYPLGWKLVPGEYAKLIYYRLRY
jgi:SAM-dependent methyltransferase